MLLTITNIWGLALVLNVALIAAETADSTPEKGCVCTLLYKPVCASNGKDYSNKCTFECENGKNGPVKIVYEGSCRAYNCFRLIRGLPPHLECCGTDGVTYPSAKALECLKIDHPEKEGVEVAYQGECKKVCVCNRMYDPVCGSDGETYSNKCMFECEKGKNGPLKIVYDGSCEAYNCFRSSRNYSPYHEVCGTDGETYPSEKVLECSKIDRPEKANVYVAYKGPCVRCHT